MFTPTLSATAVIAAATRAHAEAGQYRVTAHANTQPYPFDMPGYFTVAHKAKPASRYSVVLPGANLAFAEGKCSCPAWEKSKVCKHVYIAIEENVILAAEQLFEEEMEAKEFMLETSREHNIGFSAEVYDDTAASYGA